jgi:ribonuclease T1
MFLNFKNAFFQARFHLLALLGLAAFLLLAAPGAFSFNQQRSNDHALAEIARASLPPEAITTLNLIKQGGPFPYPRDGVVFGNYEKRLPKKQRGYYHEYTVKTPGARNRGARRIVCGLPAECYYTADHYETFKLIRE